MHKYHLNDEGARFEELNNIPQKTSLSDKLKVGLGLTAVIGIVVGGNALIEKGNLNYIQGKISQIRELKSNEVLYPCDLDQVNTLYQEADGMLKIRQEDGVFFYKGQFSDLRNKLEEAYRAISNKSISYSSSTSPVPNSRKQPRAPNLKAPFN
jgi:hypothetical protein